MWHFPRVACGSILIVLLVGILLNFGLPASADGIIVSRDYTTLGIPEMRVLFAVDEDAQQTTLTLEYVLYGYTESDFGVIVPLAVPPDEITLGADREYYGAYPWHSTINSIFDWIFERPRPYIDDPPQMCYGLITDARDCGHPYTASISFIEQDPAYQLFTDPADVLQWLNTHEYAEFHPDLEAYLVEYATQGMVFLALNAELEGGYWGWLPRITVTYPGTKTVLPLEIFSTNRGAFYAQVAILADQPFTSANFALTPPDFSQLHHRFQLDYSRYQQEDVCRTGSLRPFGPLRREYDRLIAPHNGLAIVPEYIGPSDILLDGNFPSDETLADIKTLTADYTRLSLFYLHLSPSQMATDLELAPEPDTSAIYDFVDLADYGVNPFSYWGCAATVQFDADQSALPAMTTHIDQLSKDIHHPANWIKSEIPFTFDENEYYFKGCENLDQPLEVLAPETVTLDDLHAALVGDDFPAPMLIVTPRLDYYYGLRGLVELEEWEIVDPSPIKYSRDWYVPFTYIYYDTCPINTMLEVYLLTTPVDWDTNQQFYQRLVDNAVSFTGYLDPALPNTAFITNKLLRPFLHQSPDGLIIGYPADWTINTTFDDTRHYWIVPAGNAQDTPGPRLQLIGWNHLAGFDLSFDYPFIEPPAKLLETWQRAVLEHYGLADTLTADDLEARRTDRCHDHLTFEERLFTFDQDNQRGYFIIDNYDVIEVSAPVAEFEAYEEILRLMLETIEFHGYCG